MTAIQCLLTWESAPLNRVRFFKINLQRIVLHIFWIYAYIEPNTASSYCVCSLCLSKFVYLNVLLSYWLEKFRSLQYYLFSRYISHLSWPTESPPSGLQNYKTQESKTMKILSHPFPIKH